MTNEINIQIINTCQLDCTWCGKHWVDDIEYRYMDTSTFKTIVDRCVEAGIDTFCLTPMHGEPTDDGMLQHKLLYLDNHPQVKHYFFATNMLRTSAIRRLEGLTKLRLEVSVYGDDKESYEKRTNRDLYQIFIELFKDFCLYKHSYDATIYLRYPEEPNTKMKALLALAKMNGIELSFDETHNYNWGGLIPEGSLEHEHPPSVKKGVCPTAASGCIFENGDVGLCYMNDINKSMIFGNIIEEPLQNILTSDKYIQVIDNMAKNVYSGICEKCNERF